MIGRKNAHVRKRLRDHLTYGSRCRYILWRLGLTKNEIWVTLQTSKARIALRRGTHDAHIAREIFAEGQYDFPGLIARRASVRCIIDVGANVGYSITHFATCYPHAFIYAYEPIQEHVEQIRKHIDQNRLGNRVLVHASAAGVRNSRSWIRVDGAGSTLVDEGGTGRQWVEIIDWYDSLPKGEIDLIKIDIEGGEFDLLADPRFAKLATKTDLIALEWHVRSGVSNPRAWCSTRFQECGFNIEEGEIQYGVAGTLIAINKSNFSSQIDGQSNFTAP